MSPKIKALKGAERALREVLLQAARAYADATNNGIGESDNGAGMTTAANLRIAAKPWRRAERMLLEAQSAEALRGEEGER